MPAGGGRATLRSSKRLVPGARILRTTDLSRKAAVMPATVSPPPSRESGCAVSAGSHARPRRAGRLEAGSRSADWESHA